MKDFIVISQIAPNFVITLIVFVLLGRYLDDKLSTNYIFSLILLILGLIISAWNAYKNIQYVINNQKGKK